MPVLAFEQPPPAARPIIDLSSTPNKLLKVDGKSALNSNPILQVVEPDAPNLNAYPVVRLYVDALSEATASRLAASLLGHVLFLKNQIPFPVMQLGRIPGGKTNTRAAKLRTELMASYDTISSHLDTTFSALATALARCDGPSSPTTLHKRNDVAQAHLAILVGPSLGSAKAKVMMGIDGLEKKIWGTRTLGGDNGRGENGHLSEESEEEEEDEAEDEDEDEGEDDVESGEELPADSEDEEDEDVEHEEAEEDGEAGSVESGDDSEGNEDAGAEDSDDDEEESDEVPPPPYISYAEEQRFLQTAERLLARTLASADAHGNGIASEMSPTQTHILIRAPRIFKHPAWIPRQNVSASLDATLADFLAASGVSASDLPPAKSASRKGGSKVEGVWVTARGGVRSALESNTLEVKREGEVGGVGDGKGETEKENECRQAKMGKAGLPPVSQEDAEMIWWSWDGKFVGFSDW